MSTPRPYVRPMGAWWRRNPYFLWYLAREVTCIAVGAYALLLLTGLVRATEGEAALARWLAFLHTPFAQAVQAILFIGIAYHAVTWFLILPRTIPPVIVGGRRVPDAVVRGAGVAVAACTSIALALLGVRYLA